MTEEGKIKKQIREYLATIPGCAVFPIALGKIPGRNNSVMRKGTPDIICCHWGRFIAIEVKSKKGKQRLEQSQIEHEIKVWSHGVYILARSVEDVIHAIPQE